MSTVCGQRFNEGKIKLCKSNFAIHQKVCEFLSTQKEKSTSMDTTTFVAQAKHNVELYQTGKSEKLLIEALGFLYLYLGYDEKKKLEPVEKICTVFMNGAKKYKEDETLKKMAVKNVVAFDVINWHNGLSITETLNSFFRHVLEHERVVAKDPLAIPLDKESGLEHILHAAANLFMILGLPNKRLYDDRFVSKIRKTWIIGLDIDGVVCDFYGAWKKMNVQCSTSHWKMDYKLPAILEEMARQYASEEEVTSVKSGFDTSLLPKGYLLTMLDLFYLLLPPLKRNLKMNFEPSFYVTARQVIPEVSMMWIKKHGLPQCPVYNAIEKTKVLKEQGCEIFVDDNWDNFVSISASGIKCFLMDAEHNQKYKGLGSMRIRRLVDIFE
jgi:uncharacterized HAD superfamily protein